MSKEENSGTTNQIPSAPVDAPSPSSPAKIELPGCSSGCSSCSGGTSSGSHSILFYSIPFAVFVIGYALGDTLDFTLFSSSGSFFNTFLGLASVLLVYMPLVICSSRLFHRRHRHPLRSKR